MSLKSFLVFSVFVLLITILIWYMFKQQRYRDQIIKVNITLQNNCELSDSVFMASSYPENKNAYFENVSPDRIEGRRAHISIFTHRME